MTDREKIDCIRKFYVNRKSTRRQGVKELLEKLMGRVPTKTEIKDAMGSQTNKLKYAGNQSCHAQPLNMEGEKK